MPRESHNTEQVKHRTAKDGPFCWQSKAARRRIREAFDATNDVATALGVYDALTEIASNEQAEVFRATHAFISQVSGVGVRTIQKHLKSFRELGVVEISTPIVKAPSTYHMLRFTNDDDPLRNDCRTSGTDCATFGNGRFSDECGHLKNGSEESQNNRNEKERREQRGNRSSGASAYGNDLPCGLTWELACEYAEAESIPRETVKAWWITSEANGWKTQRGKLSRPIKRWTSALKSFATADRKRVTLPEHGKNTNERFWEFVRDPEIFPDSGDAEGAAEEWVHFMKKRDWRIRDGRTGTPMPVRDYCKAFEAWYRQVWENEDREDGLHNRPNWT